MTYNASVIKTFEDGSQAVFVAEVQTINGYPQILRSNSATCTGFEDKFLTEDCLELNGFKGDSAYHIYLMNSIPYEVRVQILIDDCRAYKNKLAGLGLPPAYKGN